MKPASKVLIAIGAVIVALLLMYDAGCTPSPLTSETINAEAVYLVSDTSVMVVVDGFNGAQRIRTLGGDISILYDAETADKIWVKYVDNRENGRMVILHLHSLGDLNDGGYNHGKFGKGLNHRIE